MDIKFLQLQKRASHEYKYIQDKYNYSIANGSVALSDGTTQSFKSELWAKMIVDDFAENPSFDLTILKNRFKNLAVQFRETAFEYSPNFAKAALERDKQKTGGTGTFFGLQYIDEESIRVINCGDTCMFIIRNEKIIPFPFKSLDDLDQNNYFINSTKLIEGTIEDTFFNSDIIKIEKNDKIIVATDAISRLIFRKPEILHVLFEINNFEELRQFCLEKWESKELEEDDISIITISSFLSGKIIEIIPPDDFSFPKREEIEFTPSTENKIYGNNIEPQQMEQLNKMIQQLFRETQILKDKLKLTQVLLISTLLLLCLNTGLLFYFVNKSKTSQENSEVVSPVFPKKKLLINKKVDIIPSTNKEEQAEKEIVTGTVGNVEKESKSTATSPPQNVEVILKKALNEKKDTQKDKIIVAPKVSTKTDSLK
jgi:serine/threonine protein phosphatase PrpC